MVSSTGQEAALTTGRRAVLLRKGPAASAPPRPPRLLSPEPFRASSGVEVGQPQAEESAVWGQRCGAQEPPEGCGRLSSQEARNGAVGLEADGTETRFGVTHRTEVAAVPYIQSPAAPLGRLSWVEACCGDCSSQAPAHCPPHPPTGSSRRCAPHGLDHVLPPTPSGAPPAPSQLCAHTRACMPQGYSPRSSST